MSSATPPTIINDSLDTIREWEYNGWGKSIPKIQWFGWFKSKISVDFSANGGSGWKPPVTMIAPWSTPQAWDLLGMFRLGPLVQFPYFRLKIQVFSLFSIPVENVEPPIRKGQL